MSVSNSFQDFDWNRMTVDASFRSKKTGTTSGWAQVFHSPSTRRKRDPAAERGQMDITIIIIHYYFCYLLLLLLLFVECLRRGGGDE